VALRGGWAKPDPRRSTLMPMKIEVFDDHEAVARAAAGSGRGTIAS
jgi:hypothetical protein